MGGPFGDGSKWLDPLMPDGTRIEDDPAYQAYAAEIFNFEFEQAALLMGDPSSSAPSDASASFKVRLRLSSRCLCVAPSSSSSHPISPSI